MNVRLPAGMRNNNPGNIKYVGQAGTTPSVNLDQGDPQAVFSSPEAGMSAMYRLLMKKYRGGKITPNMMIASQGGWTPGNTQAAANVARYAGIGADDDINLSDPASAQKFMRALMLQEHGQASLAYTDPMINAAITGAPVTAGGPTTAIGPPSGAPLPSQFKGAPMAGYGPSYGATLDVAMKQPDATGPQMAADMSNRPTNPFQGPTQTLVSDPFQGPTNEQRIFQGPTNTPSPFQGPTQPQQQPIAIASGDSKPEWRKKLAKMITAYKAPAIAKSDVNIEAMKSIPGARVDSPDIAPFDPNQIANQRQQLAMAMQRLNSGKLWL